MSVDQAVAVAAVELEVLPEPVNEDRASLVPGGTDLVLAETVQLEATEPKQNGASPTKKRPKLTAENRARVQEEDDLVRLYLLEIGRYPLLTKDDEVRLAQTIEIGKEAEAKLAAWNGASKRSRAYQDEVKKVAEGEKASKEFTQANLRLVVSIAKRYKSKRLHILDIIQEGNLGLMHAVEKFDWRKGFKFSTYSTNWIKQAITRGIENLDRVMRLPVHAQEKIKAIRKAQTKLQLKLGREPTSAEISVEADMEEKTVVEYMRYAREPISLEEPLNSESEATVADTIGDPESDADRSKVDLSSSVDDTYATLKEILEVEERIVVAHSFGLGDLEPKKFKEIGEIIGKTPTETGEILRTALAKLKHPAAFNLVKDLLPESDYGQANAWQNRAACLGLPVRSMFGPRPKKIEANNTPEQQLSHEREVQACGNCAVRSQCYDLALSLRVKKGLWAGEFANNKRPFNLPPNKQAESA